MSDNLNNKNNEDIDFFSQYDPFNITPTITPTILGSLRLQSSAFKDSNKIFIDIPRSELPNGSILLIGADSLSSDTVTVIDYDDGAFSITPSLSNYHDANTEIYLINKPKVEYVQDDSPCDVIFDYKELYNFSIGQNQTYTFNFDSQDSFDQFEFINYGEHTVTKSYPTITLKTSTIGPNNFQYKTATAYGKVSVVDSCDSCTNLNFEIFTSDDDILYFNDVKKYLLNCGKSQFSQEILDVRVLNCDCGRNTFLVTYCCDKSKDVSTDSCVITWKTICKDDTSGIIDLSTPSLSCKGLNTIYDRWYYSSSTNSLVYNRRVDFCYKGCTSYDVHPSLFIEPTQPTDQEWENCPCNAPTPTETTTTTSSQTYVRSSINEYDFYKNSTHNVHLAGDAPNFSDACCFVGESEVLTKPNSSDLTSRVFYKDSNNGYFYEEYGTISSLCPTATSTETIHCKTVNNFNLYIKDETPEEKSKSDKGSTFTHPTKKIFIDIIENLSGNSINSRNSSIDLTNYVSVVDYENPPPTPTVLVDNNLIKDKSLFYKLYTRKERSIDSLSGATIAQLNWKYWFSDLPKSVYGSDTWWVGLNQSEMPSFEIIQDSTDLSKTQCNFEFDKSKVYPTIDNGNFLSDNFSLIKIKSLPIDFSFSTRSKHYSITEIDPVYNLYIVTGTPFIKFTVEYSFNPKVSGISSSYSSLTFPIKRKEEVTLYLDPYEGTYKSISGDNNFPYDFAKDKTLGITNPVYNLVQGRSNRYI